MESRADLFASEDGARRDFDALVQESAGAQRLRAPRLGDESVATRLTQPAATFSVSFYTIAWRRENVTASVVVEGFHVTLAHALELARKQDRRIADAAG